MTIEYKVSSMTLLDENLTIKVTFEGEESQENQIEEIKKRFEAFSKEQKQEFLSNEEKLQKDKTKTFKKIEQILMPQENIDKILKELKSKERSQKKDKLIKIIFITSGIGIGTLTGACIGVPVGAVVGYPIAGPGGIIVGGTIGGIVGSVVGGAVGGVIGKKINDKIGDKLLTLVLKTDNFYKQEYVQEFIQIKENYQNELEEINDLKDFIDNVTLSFIAVPVKKYKTQNPVYEKEVIEKIIKDNPQELNCPLRTSNIKRKDLVYDFDYLPKLMEKINNLIIEKVLTPKQTEAMKLILFNLYNFRRKACIELAKILIANKHQKLISKKEFEELDDFLELESTQCSKFLYLIEENSKNPQFKSSKKEEIIEIKKDKKYE